MKKKYLF